jgi:hypothetical protein
MRALASGFFEASAKAHDLSGTLFRNAEAEEKMPSEVKSLETASFTYGLKSLRENR